MPRPERRPDLEKEARRRRAILEPMSTGRRPAEQELEAAVERIVDSCGPRIRLAAPLGLGKPHRLMNALHRRVEASPELGLDVFTALSLGPPAAREDLAHRFLTPFAERHFGADFKALLAAEAAKGDALPSNMSYEEFYMASGSQLGSRHAQRHYANINYTHVARAVARKGIDVLVQKVAREANGTRLSLSCNPDLTFDLVDEIERIGKPRPLLVAEVDPHLPWIGGTAAVDANWFDHVIDLPTDAPPLFALPRQPVSDADYAIGLYASALVKDGGTLQIGIGTLSDALAQALILRHTKNDAYLELLESLEPGYAQSELVREVGGTQPFEQGLYGASEMVNDAFRVLRAAGILTRKVVDDLDLMTRVNSQRASAADLERLEAEGHFLNGAFYLGSKDLYEWLRNPPERDRGGIGMTRVSHINQLYGGKEDLERQQRRDSRFFNTCMLMTALGAAASDTLEDGRVVSGVGGQYNFVAMGHTLEDARSILMFRATRESSSTETSNVRWNYGNATIPRHLRDIAITEYGVADLRDRNDEECVRAMLQLCEARFQSELIAQAKAARKLEVSFRLPHDRTPNNAEALGKRLRPMRATGLLPPYPHGCDFTEVELRLIPALSWLKASSSSTGERLALLWRAATSGTQDFPEELERMGLARPEGWRQSLTAKCLRLALATTQDPSRS